MTNEEAMKLVEQARGIGKCDMADAIEALLAREARLVAPTGECICPKCGIRHGGAGRDADF